MQYAFKDYRIIDMLLIKLGFASVVRKKDNRKTKLNLCKNINKQKRYLEIGPGLVRIPHFETMNIYDGDHVDYVCDIVSGTPFDTNTFDVVYASHVIEHIPWYIVQRSINEMHRILKPNGVLEIWVPDGLKICKTFVEYEETGVDNSINDGWYRFNEEKDVCKWTAGRIFSYGDGKADFSHPNWHRSIFSERYLINLFSMAGFKDITKMNNSEVRGYDHGWINLGIKGRK